MDHLRVQKEIVKWLLGSFREKRSKRGHMGVLMCARLTAKHFIDWVPSRKRMRCAVWAKRGGNFAGTKYARGVPIAPSDCVWGIVSRNSTPSLTMKNKVIIFILK